MARGEKGEAEPFVMEEIYVPYMVSGPFLLHFLDGATELLASSS